MSRKDEITPEEVLETPTPEVEAGESSAEEAPAIRARKEPPIRRSGQDTFRSAMQEINMALAEAPGVLDIMRVKHSVQMDDSEAVRDGYAWADNSAGAKKIRRGIRVVLESAWQSGALNYDMIAQALRLPDLSIRGMLDVDFIEANGL